MTTLDPIVTPAMAVLVDLEAGQSRTIGLSLDAAGVHGKTATALLNGGFVQVPGIRWRRGDDINDLLGFPLKLTDRGREALSPCENCERYAKVAGLPWCRRCASRDSKAAGR